MKPPDNTPHPRILLATDAWAPQVNGVVRTYENVMDALAKRGTGLAVVAPHMFRSLPLPGYAEIRLACVRPPHIAHIVARERPDAIHIATEGPIGLATRRWCLRNARPFTTSFHTRFAEYLTARTHLPLAPGYRLQRWFHNAGAGMMVATPTLARDLESRGFRNILSWSRGVDTHAFRPRPVRDFGRSPVALCVGRLAVEKNLEAFLDCDLCARKVVVGDGPDRARLADKYPDAHFTGFLNGHDLARAYASADVLVFPSRTDTFGNVMLEAMACGLPVAAYRVLGPVDVVEEGVTGALDDDLAAAIARALTLDRGPIRARAEARSWDACAAQFLANLAVANTQAPGDKVR